MSKEISNTERLLNLLNDEITVGGNVLDRELFYDLSQGMDDKALSAVKERAREYAVNYHTRLHQDGYLNDLDVAVKGVDKQLHSWFRPWTRLAGRIDATISSKEAEQGKLLDEELLSNLGEMFYAHPDYATYRDKELKGYLYNKCIDTMLDYTLLPSSLRLSELDNSFKKDYPYLSDKYEWELYNRAYNVGTKTVLQSREDPSPANGYIGGKVNFSRYFHVIGCPAFPEGKPTGIGFINFKDCTNTYVIFDGDKKVRPVDGLSTFHKRLFLQSVFEGVKYREGKMKKDSGQIRYIDEQNPCELPKNADIQFELCGRIDGPVRGSSGLIVVQQLEDKRIIAMAPDDIKPLIDSSLSPAGTVKIDGAAYIVTPSDVRSLSYGTGQYVENDKDGHMEYVVFDLLKRELVKATSFDDAFRLHCAKEVVKEQERSKSVSQKNDKSKAKGIKR